MFDVAEGEWMKAREPIRERSGLDDEKEGEAQTDSTIV